LTTSLYVWLLSRAHMPCPSHSRLFDPNNVWWRVQIMKLIIQFYPASRSSSLLGLNNVFQAKVIFRLFL
jgi:hypothetical protein